MAIIQAARPLAIIHVRILGQDWGLKAQHWHAEITVSQQKKP